MIHGTHLFPRAAALGTLLAISQVVTAAREVTPVAQSSSSSALQAKYEAELASLRAGPVRLLPQPGAEKVLVLKQADQAVKTARAACEAAQQSAGRIQTARALVHHAKGKSLGGA